MASTQRRSAAQWQLLIQQQAESGLSAVPFCREHNLHHPYFSKRKRILRAQAVVLPDSRFIKVHTVQPPGTASTDVMVLHYRNTPLHLPAGTDLCNIAQLMALLS